MIDLLKNYKQLNNATGYLGSVRYYLAKKKLDVILLSKTDSFCQMVKQQQKSSRRAIDEGQTRKFKIFRITSPIFPTPSASNKQSDKQFIDQLRKHNHTPSTNINKLYFCFYEEVNKRNSLNETYNPNLGKSSMFGKSLSINHEMKIDTEKIPQFYFPEGKSIDLTTESTNKQQIAAIFGNEDSVSDLKCVDLVRKIVGLPSYFAPLIMKKYGKQQKKISKQEFQTYLKQSSNKGVHKKAFQLLAGDNTKKYLQIDSFKQILKIVMQIHPGLQFLKSSPEFQDFYAVCVTNRMFLMANRKNDYKMTYREFKTSNILKSFYDIESEPEINANRDYFCYEDFYVIYIKFWELDANHKFLLGKEQFSKYSGYTLSRKTIERIFSQNVKKFQHPQCMTFGDFVWFIICAEDKTTKQSIQYWFKILDLDNNGIVTGYQLEYFFEEQNQRLGDMQNSSTQFNYENMICQMVDLLKPKNGLQFTLQDFLKKSKQVGVFINSLTDLNKMQAYDQRDPYEDKAFRNDHPDWTQWDRFVKPEYKRVEAMDENQQEEEVINWENDQ